MHTPSTHAIHPPRVTESFSVLCALSEYDVYPRYKYYIIPPSMWSVVSITQGSYVISSPRITASARVLNVL